MRRISVLKSSSPGGRRSGGGGINSLNVARRAKKLIVIRGIGCLFVLAAKRQPIRGNGWIGKQDVLKTPGKRREKKEALASHNILQVSHFGHLTNIYAGIGEIVSICFCGTEFIAGGNALFRTLARPSTN